MTLDDYTAALTTAVTWGWLTEAQKTSLLASAARDGLPVIVATATETTTTTDDPPVTTTETVIDLSDVKSHMNLTGHDDDALLLFKIAAAQSILRSYIGTTTDDDGNPVSLFDDADTCPDGLKEAVRKLAAELYEQRESSVFGVSAAPLPISVYDLANQFRVWSF